MAISLYTSRIVLSALGVEDYGIWGVIGGLVSMFGFINSSLSNSILRYLTYSIGTGDEKNINKNYNASIIIHVTLAFAIFILCESIGQWFLTEKLIIPEAKVETSNIVFHIVIITSCISLLNVPFNSIIIAYERMNVYAYMAIVDVVFKLIIAYIVNIVTSDKLIWYATMMFIINIFILVFYYTYVRINFTHLHIQKVQDKTLFRSLINFSGWSLFGNVAYIGYTQGLNMLLNMFFGPVVNAARAISFQIEQTVRTFVSNFQTAINPQIIKNYAANNYSQMQTLIFCSCKFSVFLLMLFALPIILETDTILYLWLKKVPDHTVAFCRIMLLIISLECMTNAIGTGVIATGDIKKYHVIVGTILMTIVPISYICLKTGAPAESVFVSYLFIELVAVVSRVYIARQKIHLSIRLFVTKVVLRLVFVITAAAFIPTILHYFIPEGVLRFLIVGIITVFTNAISIYYLGLSMGERQMIKTIIRHKLNI